ETPLGIAAMTAEMLDDESLQEGQAGGLQGALLGQDLGHGSVPGLGPGMEGGDELGLVDQAGLERQQAKEQVPFDGGGEHGRSLGESRRGGWSFSPRRWGSPAGPPTRST